MRRPYKDLSTPPSLEAPIAARSLPLQGVIVIICDCLSKFCVSPFAVDKRRYRPPPSNIFLVLLPGLEWRMALAVRVRWGQFLLVTPDLSPMLPPAVKGYYRTILNKKPE